MKTYKCKCCGFAFEAREADRKRGWARFCSKSCKASEQTKRTGKGKPEANSGYDADVAYYAEDRSWDAHKESF
jgi:hypothetical protein